MRNILLFLLAMHVQYRRLRQKCSLSFTPFLSKHTCTHTCTYTPSLRKCIEIKMNSIELRSKPLSHMSHPPSPHHHLTKPTLIHSRTLTSTIHRPTPILPSSSPVSPLSQLSQTIFPTPPMRCNKARKSSIEPPTPKYIRLAATYAFASLE